MKVKELMKDLNNIIQKLEDEEASEIFVEIKINENLTKSVGLENILSDEDELILKTSPLLLNESELEDSYSKPNLLNNRTRSYRECD